MIERQAAYDTLTGYYHHTTEIQHKALREALERVPSAQPEVLACGEGELIAQPELLQDGTLMIDVIDLDTVDRVIVSSGKMCKVFYLDDSERKNDG